MGELAGILSNGLTGGLAGLAGIGLELWGASDKRKHELAMLEAQNENARHLRQMDIDNAAKLATITTDSAEVLANIDAEKRADEAASEDLRASFEHDKSTYYKPGMGRVIGFFMGAIDVFRGSIRPGATTYGLVLLGVLLFWVIDLHSSKTIVMTPQDIKALGDKVFDTALSLTVMMCTWWFGSRALNKTIK
jgi:hypothetical protein